MASVQLGLPVLAALVIEQLSRLSPSLSRLCPLGTQRVGNFSLLARSRRDLQLSVTVVRVHVEPRAGVERDVHRGLVVFVLGPLLAPLLKRRVLHLERLLPLMFKLLLELHPFQILLVVGELLQAQLLDDIVAAFSLRITDRQVRLRP